MKKFTKVMLLLAMIMLSPLAMSAYTLTLTIDHADRVKVLLGGTELTDLNDGDNTVEFAAWDKIEINTVSPEWIIKELKYSGSSYPVAYKSSYNTLLSSYDNEGSISLTTTSLDEMRDGTARLYVDNPAAVKITLPGTNSTVQTTEGWQDLRFSTEVEARVSIAPVKADEPLYKVILNDEEQTPDYSKSYVFNIKSGDKIEVKANLPEEPAAIAFTFVNENTSGFITSLTVNGNTVAPEQYLADNFSVMLGDRLAFKVDNVGYIVNTVNLNGKEQSYCDDYETRVMAPMTFTFDVTPDQTFDKTVNVTNPDAFKLYRGTRVNPENIISLSEGDNTVQLSARNNKLCLKIADGYYLVSLKDGEADLTSNFDNTYNNSFTVSEEGVLTIQVAQIVRDDRLVVYVDKLDAVSYFSFRTDEYNDVNLTDGYNIIPFCAIDVPFSFYWSGDNASNLLYLNDEKQAGKYGSDNSYSTSVKDGDVIKVFLNGEPEQVAVSFTTKTAEPVSVYRDYTRRVDDLTQPLSVFRNTYFEVSSDKGDSLKVKVNGTEVPKNEGKYSFTADGNTEVSIEDGTTGIDSIEASTASFRVYNLFGTIVAEDEDSFRALPDGIYIVNGRKVIK